MCLPVYYVVSAINFLIITQNFRGWAFPGGAQFVPVNAAEMFLYADNLLNQPGEQQSQPCSGEDPLSLSLCLSPQLIPFKAY